MCVWGGGSLVGQFCRRHLAVRVDPRVDEPLQYELGELVLQGRDCSVEGLRHLGHVRRDVGAEILRGTSGFGFLFCFVFLMEDELITFTLYWFEKVPLASADLN